MCICQVISYDLLENGQLFTHRVVGRTGHMGRSEVVVTFITSDETGKSREIGRLPTLTVLNDRRCLAPGRRVLWTYTVS